MEGHENRAVGYLRQREMYGHFKIISQEEQVGQVGPLWITVSHCMRWHWWNNGMFCYELEGLYSIIWNYHMSEVIIGGKFVESVVQCTLAHKWPFWPVLLVQYQFALLYQLMSNSRNFQPSQSISLFKILVLNMIWMFCGQYIQIMNSVNI